MKYKDQISKICPTNNFYGLIVKVIKNVLGVQYIIFICFKSHKSSIILPYQDQELFSHPNTYQFGIYHSIQ